MAEHEDAPIAEGEPTPAQAAEQREGERSWLERFKEAVDYMAARHQQGTAPSPALVAELRALYDEMVTSEMEMRGAHMKERVVWWRTHEKCHSCGAPRDFTRNEVFWCWQCFERDHPGKMEITARIRGGD